MLTDAVDMGVSESEDLDWKRKLPDRRDPGSIDETAKDFAAMANGAGGTIVYGVDEDPVTSAARQLTPFAYVQTDMQRLQNIAFSAIRPPISGITFSPVAIASPGHAEGAHALVVVVEPSHESPHLVWTKDGHFRAPFRSGAHTRDMSEAGLERAYQDRFARRTDRAIELSAWIDALARRAGALGNSGKTPGPHLIGVARPLSDSGQTFDPQQADVCKALDRTLSMIQEVSDQPDGGRVRDNTSDLRRARRSWRMAPNDRRRLEWTVGPGASVSSVTRVGGRDLAQDDRLDKLHTPAEFVERAVRDLVCLASASAHTFGVGGEWEISATIAWSGSGQVLFVVEDASLPGYFQTPYPPVFVPQFEPAEASTLMPRSGRELLPVMRDLATDLVAQGGQAGLRALLESGAS